MESPACVAQIANIHAHVLIQPTHCGPSSRSFLITIRSLLRCPNHAIRHLLGSLVSIEQRRRVGLLRRGRCLFLFLFLLWLRLRRLFLLFVLLGLFDFFCFELVQCVSFFIKLGLVAQI